MTKSMDHVVDSARPDRLAAAAADGPDEMGREIAEGPDAVAATLGELEPLRPRLAPMLADARRIVLAGTGASLAVCHAAAAIWRVQLGAAPELLVRQATDAALGDADGQHVGAGDLVVAISQSGTSPETLAAARLARAAGASIVAVTAHPHSALAATAELVVPISSGEEHGASTKSELATLAALLAIAGLLPADTGGVEALHARLRSVVGGWERVVASGRQLAYARRTWLVGFGTALGIAEAGMLLWHEKVIRPAVAATPSEFRHGQVEAAARGDAVILIDADATDERRAAYLDRLRSELTALEVSMVEVDPERQPGISAAPALEALLRVQQLARATALAGGEYRDGFVVLRRTVTAADDLFA